MHLLSFICMNESPLINNMFTIWIWWVLGCKRIIWCWRWSISNRGSGNWLPYKGRIWLVLSCRKCVWSLCNNMNHRLWGWMWMDEVEGLVVIGAPKVRPLPLSSICMFDFVTYVHTHTHTHTYTYIYIYIHYKSKSNNYYKPHSYKCKNTHTHTHPHTYTQWT